MDDVKAMTRAGETVGKAVGSGWLAVRRSAKRAGQASADATSKAAHAADRKLTERGVAPQQLASALAEGAEVARQEVVKTTRRARKKLMRKAKHTRKELAKAAKHARKDAKKSKSAKQVSKSARQAKKDAKEMKATLKAEMARLKTQAKEQATAMKQAGAPKKRRWPKVMLLGIAVAGVAYVVRSKAATPEPTPVPEPRHRANESSPEGSSSSAANGQRPQKSPTAQG
jgi:lipopolysaccharide export system protein LptC